jgi:hypothetical protein
MKARGEWLLKPLEALVIREWWGIYSTQNGWGYFHLLGLQSSIVYHSILRYSVI